MRHIITFIVLLTIILGATAAVARGGRTADDCPPGSTDPDCVDATKPPGK